MALRFIFGGGWGEYIIIIIINNLLYSFADRRIWPEKATARIVHFCVGRYVISFI